ncbi:hypothetical protein NG800_008080, partial [Epilithonimonas ginsengisoli]
AGASVPLVHYLKSSMLYKLQEDTSQSLAPAAEGRTLFYNLAIAGGKSKIHILCFGSVLYFS